LIAVGAALSLFFLSIFSLGYEFFLSALPVCAYLFLLVVVGIATVLGQRWARLILSILLPLQVCGLIVYVILKTPRPGQICDFSCYQDPLERAFLIGAFCLIAAWVVYPGWKTTPESKFW
jgi:hypothetical protein